MQDKFQMTEAQNVFVARRNIVDTIWKSARLEGLAVTFPETDAVFNGLPVTMKLNDVLTINNLKEHGISCWIIWKQNQTLILPVS